VVDGHTHTLYTPSYPHQVILPLDAAFTFSQSEDGDLTADEVSNGFTYLIASYGGSPTPAQLRASNLRECPADIRSTFIDQKGDDVSPSDRERLLATAKSIIQSLPASSRNEFDMAEAIRRWVSQRCLYSLTVPPVPVGQDSVSYFLFTSRKGYCDLFASSMAILCRYAGIPSRVVTGFDQGVPASDGGYDLRAMDKHAWVEVFFPGQGWYPYDPTSGAVVDNPDQSQNTSMARSMWNTISAWAQREFNSNGPVAVALFLVIVFSLAYVIKSEVADPLFIRLRGRMRESRLALSGLSSAEQAGRAWEWVRLANGARYKKMERLLAQAGFNRLPHWTPREYEAILQAKLPRAFDLRDPAAATRSDAALAAIAILSEGFTLSRYAAQADVAERLLDRERERVGEEALHSLLRATRAIRLAGIVQRLTGRGRRTESVSPVTASAAP
jgi:transglutaminase-like putative cysteine protease